MSDALSAELTPRAPGRSDAPVTLSRSRCVMFSRETALAGGAAHAAIAVIAAAAIRNTLMEGFRIVN